jgi:hypothetical protein
MGSMLPYIAYMDPSWVYIYYTYTNFSASRNRNCQLVTSQSRQAARTPGSLLRRPASSRSRRAATACRRGLMVTGVHGEWLMSGVIIWGLPKGMSLYIYKYNIYIDISYIIYHYLESRGFLKWGYPQIIYLRLGFSTIYKPSSDKGISPLVETLIWLIMVNGLCMSNYHDSHHLALINHQLIIICMVMVKKC